MPSDNNNRADTATIEAIAMWLDKRRDQLLGHMLQCPCVSCLSAAQVCKIIVDDLLSGAWNGTATPAPATRGERGVAP